MISLRYHLWASAARIPFPLLASPPAHLEPAAIECSIVHLSPAPGDDDDDDDGGDTSQPPNDLSMNGRQLTVAHLFGSHARQLRWAPRCLLVTSRQQQQQQQQYACCWPDCYYQRATIGFHEMPGVRLYFKWPRTRRLDSS